MVHDVITFIVLFCGKGPSATLLRGDERALRKGVGGLKRFSRIVVAVVLALVRATVEHQDDRADDKGAGEFEGLRLTSVR